MGIDRFYTTSITNSRITWTGESSAYTSVGTFSAHIQQAQPENIEHLGEVESKVYTVWCAKGTDVNEGDSLTIASGDYAGTYTVKSIQKNATGANEHLELTVMLADD